MSDEQHGLAVGEILAEEREHRRQDRAHRRPAASGVIEAEAFSRFGVRIRDECRESAGGRDAREALAHERGCEKLASPAVGAPNGRIGIHDEHAVGTSRRELALDEHARALVVLVRGRVLGALLRLLDAPPIGFELADPAAQFVGALLVTHQSADDAREVLHVGRIDEGLRTGFERPLHFLLRSWSEREQDDGHVRDRRHGFQTPTDLHGVDTVGQSGGDQHEVARPRPRLGESARGALHGEQASIPLGEPATQHGFLAGITGQDQDLGQAHFLRSDGHVRGVPFASPARSDRPGAMVGDATHERDLHGCKPSRIREART
jgi:hypothetical protein